jgi:dipeptidase D
MGREIVALSPSVLWKHFYALTQIPRPSGHEARVIQNIEEFAKSHKLSYKIDSVGNIIVSKNASVGKENASGVILQSHVDMVPQKNSDKQHNFETDAIETIIDGEWIRANKTTLGADNGIGCAAMLAVLEADNIAHGPIEALFTINEEAGMDGAFGLESGLLKGRILINLDSEDEGELFVGCAGGLNLQASTNYKQESISEGEAFLIHVNGLKGGHSGLDIALGRGNSNLIIGRLLWSALSNFAIKIGYVKGGDLRNAIPRESSTVVVVPTKNITEFKSFIYQFEQNVKAELKHTEPDFRVEVESIELPEKVFSEADAKKLIGVLNAAPNGLVRMSDDMPGIVETSLNLAIVKIEQGVAEFFYLLRSSVDSAKYALAERVEALHNILNWKVNFSGDYPGWKPDMASELLKTCQASYTSLFGKKPGLLAIHAGLECGIIGGKYPGLDMISFGPTIRFPHSPDEKVHVESVDKFYAFLKSVLETVN